MLVIFDLNKTIIKPSFGNKRNNEKGYVIRPHFKELYSFLKENGVKVGLYSFCRAKKFREVVLQFEEGGCVFDFLKNEFSDNKTNNKDMNSTGKKDLLLISRETGICLDEIFLVEDDLRKCVVGQNYVLVSEFHGRGVDSKDGEGGGDSKDGVDREDTEMLRVRDVFAEILDIHKNENNKN